MTTYALPQPLASAAAQFPDRLLLVADDGEWTARRFVDVVARRAAVLVAAGVEPGAQVAVRGPANGATVIDIAALGWLGACVLPLADTTPPPRCRTLVEQARATWLIDHGGEVVAAPSTGSLEPWTPTSAQKEAAPLAERFWPLEEPRLLVATSGTTGSAKIIELTTGQLFFSAMGVLLRLGHTADDRWLACLPLEHIAGLSVLFRGWFAGVTVELHERFDPRRVATRLDDGAASLVSLVPTFLSRILDSRVPRPFPSRLRAVLLGGAAAPPSLLARAKDLALPIVEAWGMSESAAAITLDGVPHALARVDVDAATSRLRVRGPTVRGELLTTDRGKVDGGRVTLAGRADALINCGAVKIDPRALEAVLLDHPAVRDVLVVGVANPRLGEVAAALLVANDDAEGSLTTEAELTALVNTRLGRSHRPRLYRWVDALPLTASGKPWLAEARRLFGEQADAPQPGTQLLGDGDGLEGARIDDRVLQPTGGPLAAVGAEDPIGEGDRLLPERFDAQLDGQAVADAHGPREVRLGVDERRAERRVDKTFLEVSEGGDEHLLVGGVAILEEAAKEGDAGPIDLEKTNGQSMTKDHVNQPLKQALFRARNHHEESR